MEADEEKPVLSITEPYVGVAPPVQSLCWTPARLKHCRWPVVDICMELSYML